MSLTATGPDRELVDGLSLDAAWDHAKYLEGKLRELRQRARRAGQEWSAELARRTRLENGIYWLVFEYESNPAKFGKSMAKVMAELNELITSE